jgi:hypothetical protein
MLEMTTETRPDTQGSYRAVIAEGDGLREVLSPPCHVDARDEEEPDRDQVPILHARRPFACPPHLVKYANVLALGMAIGGLLVYVGTRPGGADWGETDCDSNLGKLDVSCVLY